MNKLIKEGIPFDLSNGLSIPKKDKAKIVSFLKKIENNGSHAIIYENPKYLKRLEDLLTSGGVNYQIVLEQGERRVKLNNSNKTEWESIVEKVGNEAREKYNF